MIFVFIYCWIQNDYAVVLGDRSNHVPVIHTSQLLYFVLFVATVLSLATSAGLPNEWKQAAECPKLKQAAEYEYRVRNQLTPGMRIQSVMNVECHVVDAYLVSFITRDSTYVFNSLSLILKFNNLEIRNE